MNIIENLKWRYATKKFDSKKRLSEVQLTLLKEAFNLTAVSYGLQTLKLVVIKDLEDYIVVDEDDVLLIHPKSKEQEIKAITKTIKEKSEQFL